MLLRFTVTEPPDPPSPPGPPKPKLPLKEPSVDKLTVPDTLMPP